MNILIADDNPEVRSALRLLLELDHLPANVVEVSKMQDLLAYLNENCPALVLLDWELPGLERSDIRTLLQAGCPQMKLIALSSKYEAHQDALAAGVDAFVSKTEPPEQILSTLHSLIQFPKESDSFL